MAGVFINTSGRVARSASRDGTRGSSVQLGLTRKFRASCCNTRLTWAYTPVINWVVCLGQKVIS